ncbi:MAG: tryptophan--tRNA ligase [Anaerolineales bacterium]
MNNKRLLTGDRPTGKLHLGHYLGSLRNRVRLQEEYQCYFIIADIHTLTTRPQKDHIAILNKNIKELVLDYLSVGINPKESTIFLQSTITETYELNTILGMLVSVSRLERIPSLKEMAAAANLTNMPFGLLGYPVLQAADILLPRANLVPVGKDNQAHVEITRELARRFNHLYGETFPIPELLLGDDQTLVGTDGSDKMSKSLDNAIFLSDDRETVARKVMSMFTDPNRIRVDIPGRVEENPVFIFHDNFNSNKDEVEELKLRYRRGEVGDVEVKVKLAHALNSFLTPIRTKRAEYELNPKLVEDILSEGSNRIRVEAMRTMKLVRNAMGLSQYAYGNTNHLKESMKHSEMHMKGLAFV